MNMESLSLQTEKVFAYKDELLKFGGTIAGTIILAFVLIKTGDMIINRILKPRDQKFYFDERRLLTLKTLAKSILRYAVYFIVGFTVLGQIAQLTGTDLKGFLAGAGILGVALGIGAQSLVRDVITGFFILLENQYVVGEYITTGGFSGFVEEIELRVTKLRDWGGEYHIIPNGQITAVTNFSRGNMRALVEIGIAYEEDIDKALDVMQKTAIELAGEFGDVIAEGPEVLGVVALGPSEVVIRTVAKTRPMEQWRVERELRKRFKEAFDREGIEIPYPRQVIITGGAEDIRDTAGVPGSGAEYHGDS
ncbi:mechanosensitive ion channel family protein [Phosphitispora fastidiosa]|uniref:mechanosensitive ion channel family protein n=1 Tax=Phosphitispora fastidiosa TaxID=2837202 RepID=UPI001E5180D7|nr:mechanosensitive ion channel family protein [Phosphitispora fastidiosa]MBU7007529.1 small conductance mechanosensitive channel [Phosphitispora fastidiosa]